ncbi:subclass B3 metallo-beta-lactamase [Fulvimonas sp. R45]|uniref:subclass B3 metallo-beta-lactamase n=1 Tax=Fulvimonas sp. R45 TaxID=3045937 RepID=UPI00265E4C27|nr:subclass B3 metallo-beta-lactamase [Fulvimonas sp. R45]MDO1529262.1 subclass B3 metallo-beta-lactamase [Fulvimonas sp. R45]
MRLSMAAILLCGSLVQGAYAQVPAPKETTAGPAPAGPQGPFRMPASERRNIADNPSWTAPQKPFRIYGDTWYVGPRGLGIFLVTAPAGDVLIDGGVPGDAPLIEANVRALGIDLHDIKWILNSHAHSDHAGGMAQLARDTGAQVIANAADAPLLERGGRDDPEYGDRFPFPPVHVARTVTDGEVLHLGDLLLTAHSTPGHTRGNTTWTWMSCEGARCLHLVDVGSLSAPGFRLIGNPKYPDVLEDFEHGFAVVAALPCDIPLAPHPGMVDFWERVAKRERGDANALVDPAGCRAYAKDARESFEAQLAKQRADAASARRP